MGVSGGCGKEQRCLTRSLPACLGAAGCILGNGVRTLAFGGTSLVPPLNSRPLLLVVRVEQCTRQCGF